jgi:hypothetical protein
MAPGPARLALAAPPSPDDRELRVLVQEEACHGFASEAGRTVWRIDYGTEEIGVTVGVIPLPGPQECPLPPPTEIVIPLDEPVGDRSIRLRRWTPDAGAEASPG